MPSLLTPSLGALATAFQTHVYTECHNADFEVCENQVCKAAWEFESASPIKADCQKVESDIGSLKCEQAEIYFHGGLCGVSMTNTDCAKCLASNAFGLAKWKAR